MKDVKIQNIFSEVEALLKKDKRLLGEESKIIKNTLIEFVIKLDADLIKLLSKNKTTKQSFFVQIDDVLVFDKQKFLDFVNMSEFLPKSYTAFENQIGLALNKKPSF
jgi:adenine-specific DNA-methyltransferase